MHLLYSLVMLSFAERCVSESKLSKLSTASLIYNFGPEDLKEPFGCLPAASLVIQVSKSPIHYTYVFVMQQHGQLHYVLD